MATKKRAQYGTGTKPARRADGLWVARIEGGWTPQGTRRRVVVSAKTEAACKVKLKEKQRQIAAEGLPSVGNSRATVKSWSEEWLTVHARKVRPKTFVTDRGAVRKWIVPTIGHRRLAELNPADLRHLRDAVTGAGLTTTTALHAHKTLLTMLKAAVVEGHAVPVRVFEAPKPGKGINDREAIPLEQALRILGVVATEPDAPRWVAALLQGMRQGEALGLTWDAVNLEDNFIDVSWQKQELPYLDPEDHAKGFRVPDGFEARHLTGAQHLTRPKTSKGQRVIPLVPWMRAALTTTRETWTANPYGLVWASPTGKPIRPEDDRARWRAVQAAAGVAHSTGRPYHVHEARHTTATLLLAAGVDRSVIESILGQVVLVESYLHVSRTQMETALAGLADRLALGG